MKRRKKIKNEKRKLTRKKNKSRKGNICPNCGHKLKFLLKEWVCLECEYHCSLPPSKKIEKGSFR